MIILITNLLIIVAELPTFLIFPYFMEFHVTAAMPSLWMMDYQVRLYVCVARIFRYQSLILVLSVQNE